jgi:hypothetical protein
VKAAFALTPPESRLLIARAVAQMKEVKEANEKGYVIVVGSTANAYVLRELLGLRYEPQRYTAGIVTKGVFCVTDEGERETIPTVIHQGKIVNKTMLEALNDFHKETVLIKGANAVDPEGNVGIITSGFDGGTMGASLGIMTSTGLKYIIPVGLEKLVASVREAVQYTGAKTLDYSMGSDFGMFFLANALVITEIQALKMLADVEVKHVASGGVGGSEGAVILIAMGEEEKVKRAISIVEAVKGEPASAPAKRSCGDCRYACRYAGTAEEDLPAWLRT